MISLIKKSVLLMMFMSFICSAQQPNYSKLNDFLDILERNDRLMATMTITKNDEVVYSKSVGYSSIDSKIKNTKHTKFRIGSITKAFTATMIFQLIDEGRITLETPLSLFYPKIPESDKIKISNLLNHSSGLYNITNDSNFGEWMLKPSTKRQMLSRITAYTLDFTPGEKTEYSNTNYLLLGYIIEALDKDLYPQCLDKRIIKKIGLEHTRYGGKIDSKSNESYSYAFDTKKWKKLPETDMSNPGGAGAIVSTSGDLVKFMNALFNGELITSSSFAAMKKTNNNEVCHGLFYANMEGVDLYASEGGIDGFQSMLVHVPLTKTTIALVANGLNFSKMRIMLAAFAASHGKDIVLPVFTKIDLTEEQVQMYVGEYACDEVPYKLIFKAKGNVLLGAPEQSNLKELTPTKQHQFTFDSLGVILEFYPETGLLRFTRGENPTLLFKKL